MSWTFNSNIRKLTDTGEQPDIHIYANRFSFYMRKRQFKFRSKGISGSYNTVFGISTVLILLPLIACISQENKIIFQPEDREPQQELKLWVITESKNSAAGEAVPDWVNLYLAGNISELETMTAYRDKYIFVGENRGTNTVALRQWASSFAPEQDLARLVAARIEKLMISAAVLYPDDEYGEFFETFIKAAIDIEYYGTQVEDSHWIKRRSIPDYTREENPVSEERYEYLILISVNKTMMQTQIRLLMDNIKTTVPPTREQASSIHRIKQTFFERF